jgi:hypothetical protein
MHPHHFAGMPDSHIKTRRVVSSEDRLKTTLVTDQNNGDIPTPRRGNRSFHLDLGGIVAPHGVDGNYDFFVQADVLRDSGLFGFNDVFALVASAAFTDTMGLLRFLALRTDGNSRSGQKIMGPAHIAFRFGGFLLRYSHLLKLLPSGLEDRVILACQNRRLCGGPLPIYFFFLP